MCVLMGSWHRERHGLCRVLSLDPRTTRNVPILIKDPCCEALGSSWRDGQGSKLQPARLPRGWYLWNWSGLRDLRFALKKNARERGRECQTAALDISVLDLQPLPLASLNGLHSSCFPPCSEQIGAGALGYIRER